MKVQRFLIDPQPHMHAQFPRFSTSLTGVVPLLQQRILPWYITITLFTLQFTLGAAHPVGLDKRIMTLEHHTEFYCPKSSLCPPLIGFWKFANSQEIFKGRRRFMCVTDLLRVVPRRKHRQLGRGRPACTWKAWNTCQTCLTFKHHLS